MHEQAMIALPFVRNSVNSRQSSLRRASFFLSQAFAPLEAAQHTTREVNRQLRQRNETLRRHTAALAQPFQVATAHSPSTISAYPV